MSKILNITLITSEISPFSKSGGLADVTRSLSKAIKRLNHNITVITPLYGKVINKEKHNLKLIKEKVKIKIDSKNSINVNFWKGYLMDDLPVYFIENKKYFSKKKNLYMSDKENTRFLTFDVACLELIQQLELKPDIIHAHDWQTGLIPYLIKKNKRYSKLKPAKTIFTIHNLIFQLGRNWWEIPAANKDYGKRPIPSMKDPDIEYINFAKRAIQTADIVNTVSEQYREEIMTKHFGQDLDKILLNRKDSLYGIINGIDYNAYNPTRDASLKAKYSYNKIHRKKINKTKVQRLFNLPVNSNIPIISTTSRVTFQKGFELILEIADEILNLDVQLIIIGSGDKTYIKKLQKLQKKYPKKLAVIPSHEKNQKHKTQVYAGTDFLLLPSHHEPCGINQLIAMRYGCIPIVRQVGGLQDTVENYNASSNTGTGFTFKRFNKYPLYGAIVKALETYKYKYIWRSIMARAMKQSSSWTIPAKKYINLYIKALKE